MRGETLTRLTVHTSMKRKTCACTQLGSEEGGREKRALEYLRTHIGIPLSAHKSFLADEDEEEEVEDLS